MSCLQKDFLTYLKLHHGVFVQAIRNAQIPDSLLMEFFSHSKFAKWLKKFNLSLYDLINKTATIVIDVKSILISKIEGPCEITDEHILVNDVQNCECFRSTCNCGAEIYKMRPFALNFLNAIEPLYEVIAFSPMPKHKLN
jgi:hypothetical protein